MCTPKMCTPNVHTQQHVTFEELTITNPAGSGLDLRGSETNVDVLKCSVKKCKIGGMYVRVGVTMIATQCEFTENGGGGVFCHGCSVMVQIQKQDCTTVQLTTTMKGMVCMHMKMLSWIFMVQNWTSIPTKGMAFMQPIMVK
jgi:hypothetical protein